MAAADIVVRGKLRTVCVINICKRVAVIALRPENIRTGGGGRKFLAVTLACLIHRERIARTQVDGGDRVQKRGLGGIDLGLREDRITVAHVRKDRGRVSNRVSKAGNAAAPVNISSPRHIICPAKRVGIHRGSNGRFIADIVEVAARTGIGILIVTALVRGNGVTVIDQTVLRIGRIAALAHIQRGDRRRAGIAVCSGHQVQIVAAVIVVQVNQIVAAGGRLRAEA